MRVGIHLDLRNPPGWRRPWSDHYSRTLALVAEAERLGVHSVWLSEHHFFEDGYLPQPLSFAAAIAARTHRIRIGTAVLLMNLRPAIQVAEEAAIVDVLSDGRLDLGIGTGYRVPEFAAFEADLSRRYEVFESRCLQLLEFWSGKVTPPPVQQPIPLWGGFFGPKGARLAGRLGMGWLVIEQACLDHYRAGLAEGGHLPESARMAGPIQMLLADDPDSAWERIRPYFQYQWSSYQRYMTEGTDRPAHIVDAEDLAETMKGSFHVLTPADGAKFLAEKTAGAPVQEVFMWASIAGMPDDLTERHVELVATKFRELVADL